MRLLFILISISVFAFGCGDSSTKNAPETSEPDKAAEIPAETSTEANTPPPVETAPSQKVKSDDLPLPQGFEIVQTEAGPDLIRTDLDGDGDEDAVALVVVNRTAPDEYQFGDEVHMMIYHFDGKGMKEVARSGDLTGESIFYGSVQHISVKNRVISYHHQMMRSHLDVKIRYEKKKGDYFQIGKDMSSYGNAVHDGAGSTSINYLTGLMLENYQKWDPQTEENEELPEKRTEFEKPLVSLSKIHSEMLWDTP